MLGKDHVIASVSIALTTASFHMNMSTIAHPLNMMTMVVATGLGALAPDLDNEQSIASRHLGSFLAQLFRHRGFLHSFFGWALWTWVWLFVARQFTNCPLNAWPASWWLSLWWGLALGYGLHLLEDSFSRGGIMWFDLFSSHDDKMYAQYGTLLRPVHHYKDENGKKVPCRHFWGRGYQVGGEGEAVIVGLFVILIIVDIIKLLFLTYWTY